MKVIVDIEKKILKMLENNRSIFKGEYNADKLELYINKQLENEYPVITGLLSNGRKIGGYTTDNSYETEVIDGVSYTKAEFTLSKENGFNLSEGLMQVTVWMYRTKDTVVVSKEAIGNITFTVVNTTAFNEGDIIISGDVEGAVVNLKVEVENLQQVIQLNNANINKLTNEMPLIVDETLLLPVNHTDIVVGYRNSIDLDSLNKTPVNGDKFWGICKTKDNFVYSFVAKCTGEITSSGDVDFAVFEFVEIALLYDASINDSITNIEKSIPTKTSQLQNDSNFIDNTVNNLVNYYVKTETYTKDEVKALVNAINTLTTKVVTELPTTEISTTTIYLKLKDDGESPNIYEEYIYINGNWEMIGTTNIDLTEYAKKTELPTKTSQLINDKGFVIHSELPTKTSQLENDSGYIERLSITYTSQTNLAYQLLTMFKNGEIKRDCYYLIDNLFYKISNAYSNNYYVTGLYMNWYKVQSDLVNFYNEIVEDNIKVTTTYLADRDDLTNIVEIAEGKTNTYVIKASENSWFNSSDNEVITYNDNSLITTSGEVISFKKLKLGDIIYIVELDVPDRYVGVTGSLMRFYKMESSKVDLSNYAKKTEVETMIADYINSNFENGDEGSY